MNKQDVINYVMETPKNTNKAVLSTILDEYASESGGAGELDSLFDTINITLVNNSSDSIESFSKEAIYTFTGVYNSVIFGFIKEDNILFAYKNGLSFDPGESMVISAHIYKDDNVFIIISCEPDDDGAQVELSVEGMANISEDGVEVYGDCTITAVVSEKK